MFIAVEGIEGSGKSTLLAGLNERLRSVGCEPVLTREPGGGLGSPIRSLLLESGQNLDYRAELFLFLADRAQHVQKVIRPALEAGQVVLCDRFAESTIVYQGFGRGLELDLLQNLNDFATDHLWPDLTLVLDMEAEIGLERARRRNAKHGLSIDEGRFEAEDLAFHNRIRQGFLRRAALYPQRFAVLDATKSPPEIAEAAWAELFRRFPKDLPCL